MIGARRGLKWDGDFASRSYRACSYSRVTKLSPRNKIERVQTDSKRIQFEYASHSRILNPRRIQLNIL